VSLLSNWNLTVLIIAAHKPYKAYQWLKTITILFAHKSMCQKFGFQLSITVTSLRLRIEYCPPHMSSAGCWLGLLHVASPSSRVTWTSVIKAGCLSMKTKATRPGSGSPEHCTVTLCCSKQVTGSARFKTVDKNIFFFLTQYWGLNSGPHT
jgi:hypothetical protein